jgi:hypothetical protein
MTRFVSGHIFSIGFKSTPQGGQSRSSSSSDPLLNVTGLYWDWEGPNQLVVVVVRPDGGAAYWLFIGDSLRSRY